MNVTPANINRYLFFKLPSAFICGVRVITIDDGKCSVSVRHRWINQNPFNSIYFAVQAMAAELSTGALVMKHIKNSGKNFSMLVAASHSRFEKKATGRITFNCSDGELIENAIQESIVSGDAKICTMRSIGTNDSKEEVAIFEFEWTIKIKITPLNLP